MTVLWIDLPVGTQRVLHEAADQCHMTPEAFIRMLLNEAADYLLEREPDRQSFDLKRDQDCLGWWFQVIEESSSEGEPIDEPSQLPLRTAEKEGARTVNRGGRSLATDTKKRVRKAANCP